ncbi:MAG: hypothetical protein IM549_05425 [Pseudanabaena sp. M53BS1SP1A06MG]|nr:hypothetical protein [Pseudanabaena sp. M53BS1SP1A06MG]
MMPTSVYSSFRNGSWTNNLPSGVMMICKGGIKFTEKLGLLGVNFQVPVIGDEVTGFGVSAIACSARYPTLANIVSVPNSIGCKQN